MLLRSEIAFLMCAKFLHLANAEVVCLLYDDNDLPLPTYETVTVQYCYRKTQRCCETECCDPPDKAWDFYSRLLILGGTSLIIIIVCVGLVYCCKRLGSTGSPDNRYSVRMAANQVERRREIPDLEIYTNFLENRHRVAVQERNNHPVTPPPAYDVAILAPSVSALLPENRIPSYEDVMAGKRT